MFVLKPVVLGLAAFVLILAAALVIGQNAIICPKFVMTNVSTTECAGQWFLTHVVTVAVKLPEIRCFTEVNVANTFGVITTKQFVIETQGDWPILYNSLRIPIDHAHGRLAYFSTLEEENADINIVLKIEPDKYFLIGFCTTVEKILGYKIYVLARNTELEDASLTEIKTFLTDNNLSSDLKLINQTDCPDVKQSLE